MVKCPCSIASTPHAGNDTVRIFTSDLLFQLPADFFRNYRLKARHHIRIRMWPHHRTNDVISVNRVVDPIAHGLVGGIFERLIATDCSNHFSTEHAHFLYIGSLAFHIHCTHVNNAFQPHQGTNSGRGKSMLTCTCFSYNACFPKLFSHQDLPYRIVYLVRTGMIQIFPLKENVALIFF